jgi:hypothetical protein
MKKFTVGQRVRVTRDWCAARVGMVGTIVVEAGNYGIKFDKKFTGGHNLDGKCTVGYGHWIPGDFLELIEETYTTKYKPGDVVKVKSDLRKKYYCMADGSNHMLPTEQMFTKAGKKVKIKSVTKTGKYMIEGSIFPWVDEMFEDKVEVKCTTTPKKTTKETFNTYLVSVVFSDWGTEYMYLSETKYSVGDNVVVPCGTCDHKKDVKVVKVEDFDIEKLPVPLSKMKYVIGKSEKPAEPKFKVGDKVRVRTDLEAGKCYGMKHTKFSDVAAPKMTGMKGKVVTIQSAGEYGYRVNDSIFNWTDEMFEDKPVTGYCGKTVFIGRDSFPRSNCTVGKIYEFVNGQTKDDLGRVIPCTPVKSLKDGLVMDDFIEIVE